MSSRAHQRRPGALAICVGAIILGRAATGAETLPILSITQSASQVGLYQPLTVRFALGFTYANPYDPREIEATFEFIGPSSVRRTIPAFWNGTLSRWEARIVPVETGLHVCNIVAQDSSGRSGTAPVGFTAVASTERGFVRRDPRSVYHLRFDNGDPYNPVGHNTCWVIGTPDHATYIDRMAGVGENWTRFWMVSYVGTDIEWGGGVEEWAQGLGVYSPAQTNRFDASLNQCRDRGIYAQMCLDSFNGWNYDVWHNWEASPYNSANGGPCTIPLDYFTNAEAKRLAKQRYRYIVARWAAHTSVLCWELFNEIDALGSGGPWAETYHSNRALGAAWHQEMAQYIRSIDPYDHLLTTSFAHASDQWAEVWNLPEIDLVEPHLYSVLLPRAHVDLIISCRRYGKPVIMGEGNTEGAPPKAMMSKFPLPADGGAPETTVAFTDPEGATLHAQLWASVVHESCVMSWWWDNWIHPNNLYYRFAPVVSYLRDEDRAPLGLQPVAATIVSGHSGIDVYGSAGPSAAFLWIRNSSGELVSGLRLRLPQLAAEAVTAEFWGTTTGKPYHTERFTRTGAAMEVTFPTIVWDAAAKIRGEDPRPPTWHLR